MSLRPAALALALLASFSTPSEARADLMLAGEVGVLRMIASDGSPRNANGLGFAARIGYGLGLPLLDVTPEVKVAFDDLALQIDAAAVRAMVGARVSFGAIMKPAAFAHLGYGFVGGREEGLSIDRKGLALSAGVALDVDILPIVGFGLFFSYHRLQAAEPTQWALVGLEVSVSP